MPRERNGELERLYRQTGWTLSRCAREIAKLATERGTPLQVQPQNVDSWLRGSMPREQLRPLILEAFARHLRRPVTHAEAGFPAMGSTAEEPRTVEGLLDLGRQDMDPSRRNLISAGLFSVALTIPGWQDVTGRMKLVATTPTMNVGMGEVETVKLMTERLHSLDGEFGGRYARPMAAAFLVNSVVPFLNANGSEETKKSLQSAAAFLCYLTGWMAVDEGLHGLAQNYYVTALKLAGAGHDNMTYRHVLRGMSVQAAELGHGTPAVRLANAAWEGSPQSGPQMRAFFTSQQAYAYSLAGERENALSSLRAAERAVNQSESQSGSFGGFTSSTLAYATAQVRQAFGDVKGSIQSLEDHFRLRVPSDSPRSALRFSSLLAERQLQIGHLEAACATWGEVLNEYPTMHSGRLDQHVAQIGILLKPYQKNQIARHLSERVREFKTSRDKTGG